jgi:hypothetical protein
MFYTMKGENVSEIVVEKRDLGICQIRTAYAGTAVPGFAGIFA